MSLHLEDLELLGEAVACGVPRLLAIDLIDEDPRQPRVEFDADELAELAESIRHRGVRQPVSVRRSREHPQRWTLNFGARRLRASVLAGLQQIPAFEDETADSFDQLMENEQRASLTPLEVALFIKRHLDDGMTKSEIASRMAKSNAYVTMACALIDAPDWLMEIYRSGECRRLRDLYEMRKSGRPLPSLQSGTTPGTEMDPSTAEPEETSMRADAPDPSSSHHHDDEPAKATDQELIVQASKARDGSASAAATGQPSSLQRRLDRASALCDRLQTLIRPIKSHGADEIQVANIRRQISDLLTHL